MFDTSILEFKDVFIHYDELMFVQLGDVFVRQAVPQNLVTDRGLY